MIPVSEFQSRRRRLAKQLPENSIALIPANHEVIRNGDVHYRFRQDSDFYYFTGCDEPEGLLLVESGEAGRCLLFNRASNPLEEQWTGKRLGQEGALELLGVDSAYSLAIIIEQLPALLKDKKTIYYIPGRYPEWDKMIFDAWKMVKKQIRKGVAAADKLCDLAPILSEMRLIKSEAELQCMREISHISILAHERAMRKCKTAQYEYELEAEILYELTKHGCRGVAYDSIVAAGSNACTLHYTSNNALLKQGDLLLIDAGGELYNYAADITRTFPINGKFSAEQKCIYELVLSAQKAGIKCIKKGAKWDSIQKEIIQILTAGLLDLGLLRGELSSLIEQEAYKPFYMHQSGHWLGLDVHDVGSYKENGQWRALQEGMVLTVEPGLYISEHIPGLDSRWYGIGVRIEDDILVTKDGSENLTGKLVVDVADVEALLCD